MKWIGRQLLYCSLAAGIAPLLTFIFSRGKVSVSYLAWTFSMSLIFALCISIPLEQTFHWTVPKMSQWPRWKQIPAHGLTIVFFAVVGTLVGAVIICAIGLLPWTAYKSLVRDAVQISLLLTMLFGIGGLTSGMMQSRLEETNKLLRQKEEDERSAQAMATEARLMSLESRVHPHFLFNAINSILALIRDDPRRAEDLLERMAALLRFSLDQSQGRLVPLDKELTIVRDYLEIEQARFGDRLRFEVEASEHLEAEVPPLSIQTLVENSVKYAVSPRREGGRILVRATVVEGSAIVEVEDDGPGFSETECSAGHGLALVRERLSGFGALAFERSPQRMIARVSVPARAAAKV